MRQVFALMGLLALVFSASSVFASQDLIQELRKAEARYGLPDMSLVALSKTESSLKWFALNFDDGASFYPKTKQQALNIVRNVSQRPYIIRMAKPGERSEVYFFPTRESAQRAISKARLSNQYQIEPHSDGSTIRKLNLLNTGLCALQLNFRWQAHEQGRSVNTLLDPEFCIDHGAKFISGLIRKHGFKKGVGCYYTCGRSNTAQKHREEYFARYSRHYDRLSKSSGIAHR